MIIARLLTSVVILALGIAGAVVMIATKTRPQVKAPEDVRPFVRLAEPQRGEVRIDVEATGTIIARGRLTLVAEVGGRVVAVSPALEAGQRVRAGEELLRIEDIDAKAALSRAQAQVAAARLGLAQEEALAAQAASDWQLLGTGEGAALALRQPQLTAAHARLEADLGAVAQAQRDLERCRICAPVDAIIEQRQIEVGQVVGRGQHLLRLREQATQEAHVDVGIEDVRTLGLDPAFVGDGPQAEIRSVDGRNASAVVIRCTGLVDETTRRLTLVLRLPGDAGFLPGDFIQATLHGTRKAGAITLPRHLLRRDGSVLLVGSDMRLIEHPATVIQQRRSEVICADDFPAGARIVTNRIEGWSAGTEVRSTDAAGSTP